MGNNTLIAGARTAAKGFVSPQASFMEGANAPMSEVSQMAIRQAAYNRRQDEVELKTFVNAMGDVPISKIEESMRPEVNSYLIKQRNEYAKAAKLASQLDADDPKYAESISKMNNINQSFVNLSNNLNDFKTKREQFYDDEKNNLISEASNRDKLNSLYKNNSYDIIIGPDGEVNFMHEAAVIPFTDFDKDTDYNYFLKNSEGFNSLINLNKSAHDGAKLITGGLEDNYKYKLNSLFNNMSREDLLSVVYDDYLDTGSPLIDRRDFNQGDMDLLQIGNEDELRTFLINDYLGAFKTVAKKSKSQKEYDYEKQLREAYKEKYMFLPKNGQLSAAQMVQLQEYIAQQESLNTDYEEQ